MANIISLAFKRPVKISGKYLWQHAPRGGDIYAMLKKEWDGRTNNKKILEKIYADFPGFLF